MRKCASWKLLVLMLCCSSVVFSQTDVLTQHNDLGRTGWNSAESILNTSNVNSNTFGKLFTHAVDDQIYAQPLVVSGVSIPSKGTKNVVYICSVNNTVYAFDADDGSVPAYWQVNYTPAGFRVPTTADMHPGLCGGTYTDFSSVFGLVGTPVIDKAANTMYFVTKIAANSGIDNGPHASEYDYPSTGFHQFLHAVDLSTGAEKAGSPTEITATAPGVGDGNVGGVLTFDPRRHFNRTGLVLSGGIVYIAFAAHCDWNPYHGWLLGYDASTLQQKIVYITTPNDGRGGIWMSGAAPAVDPHGNIYMAAGNGYLDNGGQFTDNPGDTVNRGESIIKLMPNAAGNTATALKIKSFFTPYDYKALNDADLDFGTQVMLIPNTNMLLTGCKDTYLYLLDTTNLGGFDAAQNHMLYATTVGSNAQMHSSLAYFGGATNKYVYQLSENTLLKAFKVGSNVLGAAINGNIAGPTGATGAFMSVSSNGSDPSTGILWISQAIANCNANGNTCKEILRAIKADDVTTELWNSTMNSVDEPGNFAKMVCPTIANGKVYLPTFSKQIAVYGLIANNPRCVTNVALNKTATATTQNATAGNAFDGDLATSWTSNADNTESIYVDLGQRYDFCKIAFNWNVKYGKDFNIDVSDDATTWTTVQQVRGNTATYTEFAGVASGRYVRMAGITSGTNNGYSINEFQVYGQLASSCGTPAVLTATAITENTATLGWQPVSGATSYTVQYRASIVSSWVTRTTTSTSLPITALTCGTAYNFQVQATCGSTPGVFATGTFNTSNCTATCGVLPTRYFHADVGDIGFTGSSCLSSDVYTIKGSGTDVGGNADAFQFAFSGLTGDEEVVVQVLTQDATNAANKAGLMMRDSVSNTSRFAYIALTSGDGVRFLYRTSPGGTVTTVQGPNVTAPYWVKIQKSGTSYSAFASPDGSVWTQVGAATDLGFGSSGIYEGMAVTSANNAALSTATFGDFSENAGPLPIKLLSFTANNVNNQYVFLQWATSAEVNNDHFDVERSADGVIFEKIGQVKGAGNSIVNQYYSLQDNQPINGLNLYRLKQVDTDGRGSYSQIVPVNFGNHDAPQLYPNPANLYFTVIAGKETVREITVYDVSGKVIIRLANSSGDGTVKITSGAYASGVYIVEIKTDSKTYQQKLIKQ